MVISANLFKQSSNKYNVCNQSNDVIIHLYTYIERVILNRFTK